MHHLQRTVIARTLSEAEGAVAISWYKLEK